jgi:hypothetical protein
MWNRCGRCKRLLRGSWKNHVFCDRCNKEMAAAVRRIVATQDTRKKEA